MSNDPLYEITIAAAHLKITAPEQFDNMVRALKKLEERYKDDLCAAGPNVIFNAQGQAALASILRKRFENCLDQKKQYENRA